MAGVIDDSSYTREDLCLQVSDVSHICDSRCAKVVIKICLVVEIEFIKAKSCPPFNLHSVFVSILYMFVSLLHCILRVAPLVKDE